MEAVAMEEGAMADGADMVYVFCSKIEDVANLSQGGYGYGGLDLVGGLVGGIVDPLVGELAYGDYYRATDTQETPAANIQQ